VQQYRLGDTGAAVGEVQATLLHLGLLPASDAPAVFDDATDQAVRAFQQRRGVSVDGIVGRETYAALQAARLTLGDRLLSLAGRPYAGDDVAVLQERLLELGFDAGRVDGVFGARTEAALRGFQRDYGLAGDGVCGPTTLRALKQLGRLVVGGRPHALRETEVLHRSGAALPGKVVVIDPGHGGAEGGASGNGLREADVVLDLAARLEGRLAAVGVRVLLTRGADSCPSEAARAAFANQARADLVVSLHVDRAASPRCQGVASYHFGTGTGTGATSTVGEHLASLVQREAWPVRTCSTAGCTPRPGSCSGSRGCRWCAWNWATSRTRATRPGSPSRRCGTPSRRRCWSRSNASTYPPTSTRRPACYACGTSPTASQTGRSRGSGDIVPSSRSSATSTSSRQDTAVLSSRRSRG